MKEMEEWKFFNIKVWIFLFLISFLLIYRQACSKVSGHCSDCHTMHYSQSGGIIVGEWKSGGPFKALLIGDCIFCHTKGQMSNAPYVYSTSNPNYQFADTDSDDVLAGGDFYWGHVGCCTQTSETGYVCVHDVAGLFTGTYTPPGYDSSYRGYTWDSSKQLTCAGKWGCHGNFSKDDPVASILGAHHNNVLCNSTNCDGSTVAKSYRFLFGIKGTEDSDWEKSWDSSDHNGYYAVDQEPTPGSNTGSINYLCAECHGVFHNNTYSGSYSSPWLRHPTDYDMNNVKTKEYGNYPNPDVFTNLSKGTYFPEVPVGNTQGDKLSQVLKNPGDAIVLCISCHRAHGSPYNSILRWNYKDWPGILDNQNGCLACHTTKY